MEDKNKYNDIDSLLRGIFREANLRSIFDGRINELKLSQSAVQKLLKIERRTLNGILDGSQKRVDTTSLQKIASFLKMPFDEFVEIHSALIEKNFSEKSTPTNKKRFIKENFDLAVLRKSGFISSITDFEEIERKIVTYFGLATIFEYKKRSFDTALSAPSLVSEKITKSAPVRDFWLTSAKSLASKIDNPYQYDRKNLVNFFPQLKWFSTNEELGLINAISHLFRLGITVVFQPRLSMLYLRGATFAVNNKPVIALTDYKGFYPTIWHCLIHELFHVLFDWEKISKDAYSVHTSDDTDEILTMDENELEADDFARKFLFSQDKLDAVSPFIYNQKYIEEVAKNNDIHPSIIHAYYAHDHGKIDRMAWARARRHIPDTNKSVFRIANYWDKAKPIDEVAKNLKLEIYN
jgi:HTH-type transcriptional regulator / antitoxin HigA